MNTIRSKTFGEPLGRGVYVQPFRGRNGGLLLVAITSACELLCEVEVLMGADSIGVSDALWEQLEREDPDPRAKLRLG